MTRELHLEARPTTFKQVVGQPDACRQLVGLAKAEGGLPHCLLFTGPSGCGKTTLARIVRRRLRCGDRDFFEVNAAENRGIDMVRGIQQRVGLAPLDGEARVWLIDECHQLTADAQGAFLKLLEEPPDHVYFMLATTHPEKLRKAIRTRCTEVKVRELTEDETVALVRQVAEDHADKELDDAVVGKLAEVAEGSARKALVLLQQVMNIGDPDKAVEVLQRSDSKLAAIEIARALMARKKWADVAKLIKGVDEEPESLRWMILAYFSTVALGGGATADRAVAVMEEFQYNYFDTKRAGLIMSCYRATQI